MSKDEHLNESIISQEAKAFLAKENRSNHNGIYAGYGGAGQ